MIVIKRVLSVISVIIVTFLFLFIFNYIRIYVRYLITKKDFKMIVNNAGYNDGYRPQGLAYSKDYNVILQTSYNNKNKVSKLYVIDYDNNKLIKELELRDMNNKESYSHVGGITTDGYTVWITGDYLVSEYDLDQIINTNNSYIKSIIDSKLPIRGDFTTIGNNKLLIGDFYLKPFYNVPDGTPLMYCYDIDDIDYDNPEYIATLPKMVQGLAITDDNKYVFTRSFTWLINTDLVIYDNPLNYKNDYYNLYGKKIPLYHFDKSNYINHKKLPPMGEGLYYNNKKLYILFESNSDSYKGALPRINKILELNTNILDK